MKSAISVLEYIKKHNRATTKELKNIVSVSPRALYKILNKLVREQKIKRLGRPPKVLYIPFQEEIASVLIANPFTVTKQEQVKELVSRVPPILNVDIVIHKNGKYLIGRRSRKHQRIFANSWLFPGGRMKYDESPEDTALRILLTEVPGVKANVRKIITALSDKGHDERAYGVTIYYLCDYIEGTPQPNYQLDDFKWVTYNDIKDFKAFHDYDKQVFKELDKHVKMMYSSFDEVLVEVDKNDKEIGKISKRDAHFTNKRYHRAAHIMIFTSKGELVLHQRSFTKVDAAGFWDMFGGHQVYGHTIDQTAYAELAEELGVSCKLKFVKKYFHETETQKEFSYLYFGTSDGPYGFDKNEVEKIGFFNPEKILQGKYDKKFQIIPHVKKYTLELKKYWSKTRH